MPIKEMCTYFTLCVCLLLCWCWESMHILDTWEKSNKTSSWWFRGKRFRTEGWSNSRALFQLGLLSRAVFLFCVELCSRKALLNPPELHYFSKRRWTLTRWGYILTGTETAEWFSEEMNHLAAVWTCLSSAVYKHAACWMVTSPTLLCVCSTFFWPVKAKLNKKSKQGSVNVIQWHVPYFTCVLITFYCQWVNMVKQQALPRLLLWFLGKEHNPKDVM